MPPPTLKLLPILSLLPLSGCATLSPKSPAEAPVHHLVLCWLKEPGNPAHRKQLVETSRSFAQIPGVIRVSAGEVTPSERKIVDSSFDVGIVLAFATIDDLNTYLEHPAHKKAVQEVLQPMVQKIVVYDFLE